MQETWDSIYSVDEYGIWFDGLFYKLLSLSYNNFNFLIRYKLHYPEKGL